MIALTFGERGALSSLWNTEAPLGAQLLTEIARPQVVACSLAGAGPKTVRLAARSHRGAEVTGALTAHAVRTGLTG